MPSERELCEHWFVLGACALCQAADPKWTPRDQLVVDLTTRLAAFARYEHSPWREDPDGYWRTAAAHEAEQIVAEQERAGWRLVRDPASPDLAGGLPASWREVIAETISKHDGSRPLASAIHDALAAAVPAGGDGQTASTPRALLWIPRCSQHGWRWADGDDACVWCDTPPERVLVVPVDELPELLTSEPAVEEAADELYAAGPWGEPFQFADGGVRLVSDAHAMDVYREMVRTAFRSVAARLSSTTSKEIT